MRIRWLLLASFMVAAPGVAAAADSSSRCPFSHTPEAGVLVAWTTDLRGTSDENHRRITVGAFRPLVAIRDGKISESDGAAIADGQQFWHAVDPGREPVRLAATGSFLDQMGTDHCVYYATTEPEPAKWVLLTSRPLQGALRAPTAAEKQMWRDIKPECRQFADYDEKNPPPCRRSEILAVSDINRNGEKEFWATEHYAWDTGLTIWEDRGENLPVPLLRLCVGCSD